MPQVKSGALRAFARMEHRYEESEIALAARGKSHSGHRRPFHAADLEALSPRTARFLGRPSGLR